MLKMASTFIMLVVASVVLIYGAPIIFDMMAVRQNPEFGRRPAVTSQPTRPYVANRPSEVRPPRVNGYRPQADYPINDPTR